MKVSTAGARFVIHCPTAIEMEYEKDKGKKSFPALSVVVGALLYASWSADQCVGNTPLRTRLLSYRVSMSTIVYRMVHVMSAITLL